MFKLPQNAFANVKCPQLASEGKCDVTNCIFFHGPPKRPSEQPTESAKRAKTGAENTIGRPTNSSPSLSAAAKPTGGDLPPKVPEKDLLFVLPKSMESGVLIPRVERTENCTKIAKYILEKRTSTTPNRQSIETEYNIACGALTLTEYRDKVLDFLHIARDGSHHIDPKHITPLSVNPSPALLPVRRKFIELFAEALRKSTPTLKTPVRTAIEEEFAVASKNSSSTYNYAVKQRLHQLTHPDKVKQPVLRKPSTEAYLRELRDLCISKEKLVKYGFIMDVPAKIDGPEPVRQCHRCKVEFKLEDSETAMDCRYHSGKPIKNNHKVRVYLCCGGALGETDTEPCAKGDHHVFYWTNPQEMHHFLPFIETRKTWGTRKGSLAAIGIDCEMGFTTKGFELLRLTAMDFFTGEEVLDILVRPKGAVLDLNTRWSGVAEIKAEALTFEDLITLLGEVADANTIMVGHGLENDMNAMRLIHDKIVDTAVLYPKHKTSPTFRFSLKQLTFQYLGRAIQAGEHDSGEDSLAAIDITKFFIEQDLNRRT